MSQRLGDWLISREWLTQLLHKLDGDTLLSLEGLPADARVVGIQPIWDRDCLAVRFASEEFPEVFDGDPVPRIDVNVSEAYVTELRRVNAEMAALFGDRVQDSELARQAVAREREACARIVEAGGDGVDRLETAIALGTNAAIAEAIRARADP